MSIVLVTYDLKQPGRDYAPVHRYLRAYTHCKGLESVWLLDTQRSTSDIRDDLKQLVDSNDVVFVAKIQRDWAASNYSCGSWLNEKGRNF
ncbi:CRISPR-associated endoribonuclease Cas2 [Erythrobacter sp. THAF29]|nr:CRISPR-associated endoribonuclease Cas2 [Erythrobacter sp. THAF29]